MNGIDHLQMYVGSLTETRAFFMVLFGFHDLGEPGPEARTGAHRCALLGQGDLRLVLVEGDGAGGPVAEHLHRHGDCVKDIAFSVPSAERAFRAALEGGAIPVLEPTPFTGEAGRVIKATIAGPGDLVHSFVQREDGARRVDPAGTPFTRFDHIALCLPIDTLDDTVAAYEQHLGFVVSHREVVQLGQSGMNSKVVRSLDGSVKFAIQEPLCRGVGQIATFVERHGGAGVQHVAFLTPDIVGAMRSLRARGVRFLDVPSGYYADALARVGAIEEDTALLAELGVLMDRDATGYLLQAFTAPTHPRGTLFFEVIQRNHAEGFGSANIRALYEAVERDQVRGGAS